MRKEKKGRRRIGRRREEREGGTGREGERERGQVDFL